MAIDPSNIKICLIMIVKDEEDIILESSLPCVAPFIDAWCIDDTGSTDSTPELIENFFSSKDIPGKLHRTNWLGFADSRTRNLEHAEEYIESIKKDEEVWYMFPMDADDLIFGGKSTDYKLAPPEPVSDLPEGYPAFKLDKNFIATTLPDDIAIPMVLPTITYDRVSFVKYNPEIRWMYESIVHEYIFTREKKYRHKTKRIRLKDGYYIGRSIGARSKDPARFINDAFLMIRELYKDPEHRLKHRYLYYIGQSFRDSRMYEESEKYFLQRAELDGWHEEKYLSWVGAAKSRIARGLRDEKTISYLLEAINVRPERLEAPYQLLLIWRHLKKFKLAWNFGKAFIDHPYPVNDTLFVEHNVHHWEFLFHLSICAFWAGHKSESKILSEKLLSLPLGIGPTNKNVIEQIKKNLSFCK